MMTMRGVRGKAARTKSMTEEWVTVRLDETGVILKASGDACFTPDEARELAHSLNAMANEFEDLAAQNGN